MSSAQVVETSVTNNSSSQNYPHPDDHTIRTSDFTVVERARWKFISESFESELNSDPSDENEMILKQNLDVLVPKYIRTINFAVHFLEQTESVYLMRHCVWSLVRRHQHPPP